MLSLLLRAEHLTDKTTADFFQRFETTAVLPGESLLRVTEVTPLFMVILTLPTLLFTLSTQP